MKIVYTNFNTEVQIEVDVQHPKCHAGLGSATAYAVGGSGSYTFNWFSASAGFPSVSPQPAPEAIFLDAPTHSALTITNADIICEGTGSHLPIDYVPSHSGYCALSLFANTSAARLGDCNYCFTPERVYCLLSFFLKHD